MKNLIAKSLLVVSVSMAVFTGCSKSDNTVVVPPNNNKGTSQANVNGIAIVPDSAYATASMNSIIFYKDFASTTDNKTINIVLTSLSVGSYTLTSSTPNSIKYTLGGTLLYTSQSGTVNITANNGTRISGNYNAMMNGSAPFSGSFTDLLIR